MNSGHNWDNYAHQTLYDRIHGRGGFFGGEDGAGVSGATGAQDGWTELAAMMAEAREQTEAALAKAGAVWEGAAADSMRSGIAPLAQWADDSHTAGTASQSSTDSHVGAYAAAKNQMPEPVPVTSTANSYMMGIPAAYTHLYGGQTDQDRQEAEAQEAKAEAVRVMSGYDGESGAARSGVGEFVPPPSVIVEVPPPQPKGGDIPGGGDVSGPGGAGGGDGARSAGDTGNTGGSGSPVGAPHPGATPPGTTPPGTTPSAVTPTPTAPGPITTNPGVGPDPRPNPLQPIGFGPVGRPTDSAPGGRGPGSGGRGPGIGGTPGRGPGGAGPGAGGPRGGIPGVGALANEPVAGRPGTPGTAGARGAGGMGTGPMGAGRGQGEEDKEHQSPEYLRATHDSFWDGTDPVAPPVIGEDDD